MLNINNFRKKYKGYASALKNTNESKVINEPIEKEKRKTEEETAKILKKKKTIIIKKKAKYYYYWKQ